MRVPSWQANIVFAHSQSRMAREGVEKEYGVGTRSHFFPTADPRPHTGRAAGKKGGIGRARESDFRPLAPAIYSLAVEPQTTQLTSVNRGHLLLVAVFARRAAARAYDWGRERSLFIR